MSWAVIRKLMQKRLRDLDPAFQTSLENTAFTPANGTPYQRVTIMKSPTLNPTMGDGFVRERGMMQVLVQFPSGTGTAAAEAKAQQIKNQFKRGTTLTEGLVTVRILEAPYEVNGATVGEWYKLPVYVPITGDVYQ